jgi:hypothetical protein
MTQETRQGRFFEYQRLARLVSQEAASSGKDPKDTNNNHQDVHRHYDLQPSSRSLFGHPSATNSILAEMVRLLCRREPSLAPNYNTQDEVGNASRN